MLGSPQTDSYWLLASLFHPCLLSDVAPRGQSLCIYPSSWLERQLTLTETRQVGLCPLRPTGKLSGTLSTATFKCVVASWVYLSTELPESGNSSCHRGPAAPPSVQFSTQTLSRQIAVSMTTEEDASTLHLTQQ